MGRSGDTMFCGSACVLHTDAGQCRSGRSAIPCGGCAGCSGDYRAGLPAVGTPSATPSDWVRVELLHRWGAPAAPWSVIVCILHTGAGLCRSGRSATPCSGCAGCSGDERAGLPAVGTPSAIPSVWVGVHPKLCWTLRAAKHFTCLRDAPGDSLLAFGLLLVWV